MKIFYAQVRLKVQRSTCKKSSLDLQWACKKSAQQYLRSLFLTNSERKAQKHKNTYSLIGLRLRPVSLRIISALRLLEDVRGARDVGRVTLVNISQRG